VKDPEILFLLVLIESGSLPRSYPAILASSDVGRRRVVSILIIVVFPAPLGPKSPKSSLGSTENETLSTTVNSPNFLSTL